ncbi:MAG: D-glycero-beta-D-manno-heptose 1-phosphate adenylyltransferase [Gemmatimonadetes bacterium]|nr:D-glycero-beta-D-manno-heptose 1-phosphate adenylyltransferase [Gemmatimonadota bacterium]NNK49931.1 D-glycero-beta-D-manno-heptose 1-phosphate adenylyltransferase [Gemmatimonadota bacterium]
MDRDELVRRYGRPRNYRLVFTNGVFDLLHKGHVASLEAARSLGDALIVGVNSDESTRRLKGPRRPYQSESDRAEILASSRFVDAVTVFGEDTPEDLIAALLPDVLVKGADYSADEIAGAGAVRAAGGEVVFVQLEDGLSSSGLVRRILAGGAG